MKFLSVLSGFVYLLKSSFIYVGLAGPMRVLMSDSAYSIGYFAGEFVAMLVFLVAGFSLIEHAYPATLFKRSVEPWEINLNRAAV